MDYKKINWREVNWRDQLCLSNGFDPENWNWFELKSEFVLPVARYPWLRSNIGDSNDESISFNENDIFALALGDYQDNQKKDIFILSG